MNERSNDQWITDLASSGPRQERAIADLRGVIGRGLRAALAPGAKLTEADLQDFVQQSTMVILNALPTFRGESRFVTWALKISVHEALTELRHHRWRDTPLEQGEGELIPEMTVEPGPGPERQAVQGAVLRALRDAIRCGLTERQRKALVAIHLQGMPLSEVARRLGTNRNALYKLVHDARQRLRTLLLADGLSPEEILHAFSRETGGSRK